MKTRMNDQGPMTKVQGRPKDQVPRQDGLRWMFVGAVAVLAGCAVGPDFRRPVAPTEDALGPTGQAGTTVATGVAGGTAQRLVPGQDVPGQWWTLFGCAKLATVPDLEIAGEPQHEAPGHGGVREAVA